MYLVEYKRDIRGDGLELVGEADISAMQFNHVYKGKLENISEIRCGSHLHLLKKSEIEKFSAGGGTITVTCIQMKENYSKRYALSHSINEYANGRFVDEVSHLLKDYPDEEYSIISASDFGQFFAYTDYVEDEHYHVVREEGEGVTANRYAFVHKDMREHFSYRLRHLLSISNVHAEIGKLKIADDMLFVHHETGIGYATKDMEKLKKMAGYIYQNYLIVDEAGA
jgi:hypothetical protein